MESREEMIARLQAEIDAGTYGTIDRLSSLAEHVAEVLCESQPVVIEQEH